MANTISTALVSAFARAFHHRHHNPAIYDDPLADRLLTPQEYEGIAHHMSEGIGFFCPGFTGSEEEALHWVVDQQLSPTPVGRAAFAEEALERACGQGLAQYVNIAAGYDTFACRAPAWADGLQMWELDHPATGQDKQARLRAAGIALPGNVHVLSIDLNQQDWAHALRTDPTFHPERPCFFAFLGISYYLAEDALRNAFRSLATLSPRSSLLAFDYPDEDALTDRAGSRAKRQAALAATAGEPMLAGYSPQRMEALLADCGFRVVEHLAPPQITERFFRAHNEADPTHAMTAFDNVNYCLAVRA